ncbi:hypothetical protein QU24_04410 [Pantoea rodasii]|uniref:Uncharacterized protein n=1 Tax=Pantoea rodasii TaxID=1076549 RepID=A0A0B1R8D9_9GAMM|nr:hypothetical protein QU24_04410 [Pantoea rodasii]
MTGPQITGEYCIETTKGIKAANIDKPVEENTIFALELNFIPTLDPTIAPKIDAPHNRASDQPAWVLEKPLLNIYTMI